MAQKQGRPSGSADKAVRMALPLRLLVLECSARRMFTSQPFVVDGGKFCVAAFQLTHAEGVREVESDHHQLLKEQGT